MFRSIFAKLIAISAIAASAIASTPEARAEDKAGNFDFYVLALSWSPTFCSGERGQKSHSNAAPRRNSLSSSMGSGRKMKVATRSLAPVPSHARFRKRLGGPISTSCPPWG